MIRNYVRIALRSLVRNKLFSTVNILGLAFGIGSALLIFLWVKDELQVDHFHANTGRLYRVMELQKYTDGRVFTFSSTPGPMAPAIKNIYPEIERATRFTWSATNLLQVNEKSFFESGRYADQDFIEMFSFPLLVGDVRTALREKNTIVLTRPLAEKYFGRVEDALGKVMTVNTKDTYTVTGVFADVPKSSSFSFDYIVSFQTFWDENKEWLDQWGNNNIRTYLLLKEGTSAVDFEAKFKDEVRKHDAGTNVTLFIQRFEEAYLHGNFENGVLNGGRIDTVRIFFAIAVFVLVIACINFTNLSTAQATKRAKEVGLRKVIGAVPQQLFRQFMGESFLMVFLSGLVAMVLVWLLMPLFNDMTGKAIGMSLLDGQLILVFVGIIVFTAVVAGSYPALFISEFKPVQVLKGQLKSGSRASLFRKGLVVIQFSLSILLIISTVVVYRQMSFMEKRDIGFNRDNLFYVWMQGDMKQHYETLRSRLLASPGIASVTASGQNPISVGNSTIGVKWDGKSEDDRILFSTLDVDQDFIQSMGMTMHEGRGFERDRVSDTANFIVNEKAAAKFGFKHDVAGQDLSLWDRPGKIVGVVKDFNFGSLHSEIEPLILYVRPEDLGCLLVRVKDKETEAGLKSMETLWKEYAPAYPFKYSFLNQDWEELYKSEGQRGKIFNAMAVLSIFISCLGLFGLSAFSAERRTKELGIRKALGASTSGLIRLMSREFTVLVLVSAVIGCPLGWYLMDRWLKGYAYHVEVGVVTLVVAAVACLVISLVTVFYHSVRVAREEPVRALRTE